MRHFRRVWFIVFHQFSIDSKKIPGIGALCGFTMSISDFLKMRKRDQIGKCSIDGYL
jgi:hypothetical protein